MAAYLIASYRVTNPEGYQAYPPAVLPVLDQHGAELLVADFNSEALEGEPSPVTVVVRFPSKAAARAWYQSPEYQDIAHLRTDNTQGTLVFTDAFAPPT